MGIDGPGRRLAPDKVEFTLLIVLVPLRIERETARLLLWLGAALPVGVLSAPATGAAAPRPDDSTMTPASRACAAWAAIR